MVADVEHRQRLIDADDAAAFNAFGQRPRHAAGASGQIQNYFIALQRQRFDQLGGQVHPNIGQRALIELGRMGWIVETRLVTMIMAVFVLMFVAMRVRIFVAVVVTMSFVPARVALLVVMLFVAVIVRMLALMFVFMFVRHFLIPILTIACCLLAVA
jgi:hypothetical protein